MKSPSPTSLQVSVDDVLGFLLGVLLGLLLGLSLGDSLGDSVVGDSVLGDLLGDSVVGFFKDGATVVGESVLGVLLGDSVVGVPDGVLVGESGVLGIGAVSTFAGRKERMNLDMEGSREDEDQI